MEWAWWDEFASGEVWKWKRSGPVTNALVWRLQSGWRTAWHGGFYRTRQRTKACHWSTCPHSLRHTLWCSLDLALNNNNAFTAECRLWFVILNNNLLVLVQKSSLKSNKNIHSLECVLQSCRCFGKNKKALTAASPLCGFPPLPGFLLQPDAVVCHWKVFSHRNAVMCYLALKKRKKKSEWFVFWNRQGKNEQQWKCLRNRIKKRRRRSAIRWRES